MNFIKCSPPFNSVALFRQADTKPGCVLRPANVVEVLQRKRNLLTQEDVETCKGGMNTWGFVGDLNDHPQLSCVYQSDDAQNEFLSNPKVKISILNPYDSEGLRHVGFLLFISGMLLLSRTHS